MKHSKAVLPILALAFAFSLAFAPQAALAQDAETGIAPDATPVDAGEQGEADPAPLAIPADEPAIASPAPAAGPSEEAQAPLVDASESAAEPAAEYSESGSDGVDDGNPDVAAEDAATDAVTEDGATTDADVAAGSSEEPLDAAQPIIDDDSAAGSESTEDVDSAAQDPSRASDADAMSDAAEPAASAEPAGDEAATDAAPASQAERAGDKTAGDPTLATQGGEIAPKASISYRTHVQRDGWQGYVKDGKSSGTSGRSLRLEGIKIYLTDGDGKVIDGAQGGVQYQVHVQSIGWQEVKANDAMAGTSGKSYRLEAIRISLTGELSRFYDVTYRTHVQSIGWQGWRSNGDMAGTEGRGLRLEAIEIKLQPKKTPTAATGDGIVDVRYRGHVQSIGWQPYGIGGDMAGTSGRSLRVEALNLYLDKGAYSGGIEYCSHVQRVGWQDWVKDGAMTGTSGRSLRVEALKIRLTGDIAKNYDVVYRAHVQSIGWQNWSINGTMAGTSGRSLRVEALQVKLVKKGSNQVISEGTYFFSSAANPAVTAEDPGASTKANTQARGYTTNYTNAQRYYVRDEGSGTYSIQSVASGLFLADNGGKVVQVADSSAAANRWKAIWNGGYSLVNVASGKEIGFASGTAKSGTSLTTLAPAQKSSQRWTLTETSLIGNGTYQVVNARSGNVLDIAGSSWDNGANVTARKSNDGGNQAFTFKNSGGDTYRIVSAMNGKVVEVQGGSSSNGANVRQNAANGSKAQLWDATLSRSGKITFTNQASGKVLTAASTSNGANVNSSKSTGSTLQQWTLRETTYKPDPVLQRAINTANANSSSTQYLITVDLTNNRTVIFQGKKGSWSPMKNWSCSTGSPSTPTVLGNYTITGYRMYSFGHGYTCYYATQFWGDYLFHSVLYNEGTFTIQDGRLGKSISLGCVRLDINNAKWIYNNIPAGTFVKTYY